MSHRDNAYTRRSNALKELLVLFSREETVTRQQHFISVYNTRDAFEVAKTRAHVAATHLRRETASYVREARLFDSIDAALHARNVARKERCKADRIARRRARQLARY